MTRSPLATIPALRLLLPFALGIAVASRHGTIFAAALLTITGIASYAALHLASRTSHKRRHAIRALWIVPVFIISTAAGMATAIIHRPADLNLQKANGTVIEARITDIYRKDFSVSMTATLLTKGYPLVQLSTRGCDYTLEEGDYIRFICNLKSITNQGNPDEMDYAAYMWRKGIKYQQHFNKTPFHYKKTYNVIDRLYGLRHRLETKVMTVINDPVTQQLVIAMLLGDSHVIDKELRDEFSRAGIAHILALSGLHVGIIVWIVWMLLFPLDYWCLKKLRLVLTIVALGAFCAITGFSPSVVRAALMIAMSFTTYILYRRYSPINTLAVAALLILIFDPFQLYSIGFQLSFITMTALLVTLRHWRPSMGNRLVRYAMTTIATSVVAMLATMIITAYYFNTISLVTPLSNLLVLPLLPLVLVLGAIIIFLVLLGVNIPLVEWLTNGACKLLQWAGNVFGRIEGGHLNNIYISGVTLTLYFIALTLIVWWIFNRRKSILVCAIAATIGMALSQVITTLRTPVNGLVVFNNFKYTPILAFDHGNALLWIPDYDDNPKLLGDEFIRQHSSFIAHYRINSITTVTTTDTILGNMAVHPPFALLNGKHIAVVDNEQNKSEITGSTIKNDILIMGRHFKGNTSNFSGTLIYSGATNALQSNLTMPRVSLEHHLATEGAYILLN